MIFPARDPLREWVSSFVISEIRNASALGGFESLLTPTRLSLRTAGAISTTVESPMLARSEPGFSRAMYSAGDPLTACHPAQPEATRATHMVRNNPETA